MSKKSLQKSAIIDLPTSFGNFKAIAYLDKVTNKEHFVLIKGDISNSKNILVRVHSECLTGDVFSCKKCDCGPQLNNALKIIEKEGRGVLIYLRQEGRGIGLINKIEALHLQEEGKDTVEANLALGYADDLRNYLIAAQILTDLGIKSLKLITNNPRKITGLEKYGLKIIERIPSIVKATKHNKRYLNTKKDRLGHFLK